MKSHIYLFLIAAITTFAAPLEDLGSRSITEIEARLQTIEDELSKLARFSLRNGVGSIGYRSSDQHAGANATEWVEVQLDQSYPINHIVLVPVIWHDAQMGYRADAFPVEFRIRAGTHSDTEGSIVATFAEKDARLPRLAPLIIPCDIVADWVRVEATRLSPRGFDGKYCFQLSELMLFKGGDNVALHQTVKTTPKEKRNPSGFAYDETYLVDGHLPYVMNSGRGESSAAFISQLRVDAPASLTIDLGGDYPVDRIQLHTIEANDTIPQSHPSDFGVPHHFLIEGAQAADFSNAHVLANAKYANAFQSGPILIETFPRTSCRFIRLKVLIPDLYEPPHQQALEYIAGFAEFEIFSEDINVAQHKAVYSDFPKSRYIRSEASLTDGRNIYGEILPIRQWLLELARRHELETERPIVKAALTDCYARQKDNLRRMIWLASLLAAGIVFTILIGRMLRMRSISGIKDRLAADLHDELGANIHAIDLLNEIAKDSDSEDERKMLSSRIAKLTTQTGVAVRNFSKMLEAKKPYLNLIEDMQRTTKRIATNIEYDFSISGKDKLEQLKPRMKADFFLFYKESLVNVCRHSGATKMNVILKATPRKVLLTIDDNGVGITDSRIVPPPSLVRRAKLIGAKISASPSPLGGVRISLVFPKRRRLFLRKTP